MIHTKKQRGQLLILALALFVAYSLCVFLLLPLWMFADADVMLKQTVVDELLYFLYHAVEWTSFFVTYAFLVRLLFDGGARVALGAVAVSAAAIVYRHGANLLFSWGQGEYVAEDALFDMMITGTTVALEWAQLGIVWLVVQTVYDRTVKKRGAPAAATLSLCLLPGRDAPLSLAAAASAAVVLFVNVMKRVLYDVSYGMPQSTKEWLYVAWHYGLDVATAVLGYAAMLLLLWLLRPREKDGAVQQKPG